MGRMESEIAGDAPVLMSHLKEMKERLEPVQRNVDSLLQHIASSGMHSKSDIDILGLKNQLLLRWVQISMILVSLLRDRATKKIGG